MLGFGAVGTLAAWTDTSTATSGTFSTGTVDLKIGTTTGNAVDTNPSTFTTGLTLTNMVPGASKSQTLVVVNSGTVAFGYTVAGTATNNGAGSDQLGTGMTLNVYAGSGLHGNAAQRDREVHVQRDSVTLLGGRRQRDPLFPRDAARHRRLRAAEPEHDGHVHLHRHQHLTARPPPADDLGGH